MPSEPSKICRRCGIIHEKPTDLERFMDKVLITETCWLWTGASVPRGYGIFVVDGRNEYAHRWAFRHWKGLIPPGLFVLHDCPDGWDEPACVNPAHLWAGTHLENMQDMTRKGHLRTGTAHHSYIHPERVARGASSGASKHPEKMARGDDHWSRRNPEKRSTGERHRSRTHPESIARGENHSRAKLTDAQVEEIITRYKAGGITQSELAVHYGASQANVNLIVNGKSRKK